MKNPGLEEEVNQDRYYGNNIYIPKFFEEKITEGATNQTDGMISRFGGKKKIKIKKRKIKKRNNKNDECPNITPEINGDDVNEKEVKALELHTNRPQKLILNSRDTIESKGSEKEFENRKSNRLTNGKNLTSFGRNLSSGKNLTYLNDQILQQPSRMNLRRQTMNARRGSIYDIGLEKPQDLQKSQKVVKKIPRMKKIMSKLFTNSVCICCNSRSKDAKLLEEIKKSFYSQLDVFYYLKIIQTLRLMNYVILEDDESYLLSPLCKPTISFGEDNDMFHFVTETGKRKDNDSESNSSNDEDIYAERTDKFWVKFAELMKKNDKTITENKIYQLLCADINNLIS